MLYTRLVFAALALITATQVSAEFKTVVRAYEVELSDFEAPRAPSGPVAFKACTACDTQSLRVTPKTTYIINRRATGLQDFLETLAAARTEKRETVIVMHHLETDTVSSLLIYL
jgi:cytochrome c2